MKILFVANSAWYLSNFRGSTLSQFSKTSRVVCLTPFSVQKEEINLSDVEQRSFFLNPSSKNPFKELAALVSLLRQIISCKPDLAFSFNPKTNLYTLIVCWLLRIPCVPNVSGVGVASQMQGITAIVYNKLAKFFYRRASYVFFQNNSDRNAFIDAGWVLSKNSEVLAGSGVNLKEFEPCIKKTNPIRFLMASRLIKSKGVIEFLLAANHVVKKGFSCEFLLAGVMDHSNRSVDQSTIKSLCDEENIYFLGHVQKMPELLNSVDCVILPSYYPEGTPRSLIEAAASGKIIITTNTPGCSDTVINGENGYLVEPRSATHLAEAMINVLQLSDQELLKMKSVSRNLAVNKFDERINIARYQELSKKIIPATPSQITHR